MCTEMNRIGTIVVKISVYVCVSYKYDAYSCNVIHLVVTVSKNINVCVWRENRVRCVRSCDFFICDMSCMYRTKSAENLSDCSIDHIRLITPPLHNHSHNSTHPLCGAKPLLISHLLTTNPIQCSVDIFRYKSKLLFLWRLYSSEHYRETKSYLTHFLTIKKASSTMLEVRADSSMRSKLTACDQNKPVSSLPSSQHEQCSMIIIIIVCVCVCVCE